MITDQLPLYLAITAGIALVGDGIDVATRTYLYRKNNKMFKEFREELSKFKHEKPEYGFVLPLYKNPGESDKCLEDLITRVKVPKTEIITVDDFSNDNNETRNIAKKYDLETLDITKEEKDVRKVRAQRKGVEKWLERGKKYVICLDSDCYINNSLSDLELAMAEMDFFKLDAMAGQVLPKIDKDSTLLERIQMTEYKQAMRIGRGSMYSLEKHNNNIPNDMDDMKGKYSLKQASQLCVSGAFGIFKPEMLKQALDEMKIYGGGEDTEITLRLLAKKAKIGYNNSLVIDTEAPNTMKKLFSQRDKWAQFISNYTYDSKYIENAFRKEDNKWKPNYDAGGIALRVQTLRDIYMHPVKLATMPALLSNPSMLATFFLTYSGISTLASYMIKDKEEKFDWAAEALLPLYDLAHLIGPKTVGYAKQIGRRLNFKQRKKNKQ
ncbi:glycosyltransferase family 2 protein [Candidatus Woesearchaeota archaeon]|nr:glycosyltransferase family 2 protein [Candidatus Woesearchaeota archaeon]